MTAGERPVFASLLCRNTGTYAEACDLDHCQNLPNKHDHLHKEYKYRNGAFRWVSKPDAFDSVQWLSLLEPVSQNAAQGVPVKGTRSSRSPSKRACFSALTLVSQMIWFVIRWVAGHGKGPMKK